MNAFDREKVYEGLRNYHINKLPEIIENPVTDDLRNQFTTLEDQVIIMILRFTNEKEKFIDFGSELQGFKVRLESTPIPNDNTIKNLLFLKVQKLLEIILLVKKFSPSVT